MSALSETLVLRCTNRNATETKLSRTQSASSFVSTSTADSATNAQSKGTCVAYSAQTFPDTSCSIKDLSSTVVEAKCKQASSVEKQAPRQTDVCELLELQKKLADSLCSETKAPPVKEDVCELLPLQKKLATSLNSGKKAPLAQYVDDLVASRALPDCEVSGEQSASLLMRDGFAYVDMNVAAEASSAPSAPREDVGQEEDADDLPTLNTYRTASFAYQYRNTRFFADSSNSSRAPACNPPMICTTRLPVALPVAAPCYGAPPEDEASKLLTQANALRRQAAQWQAEAYLALGVPTSLDYGEQPPGTFLPQQPINTSQPLVNIGGGRTTVMLRNIPNNYTRAMLLELLDNEGFAARFDFIYLPIDFKKNANFGYAFVNLVSAEEAARFYLHFTGFRSWSLASQKVGEVGWGEPLQGLQAHIERYRNSPVMHGNVPEEHKPLLFSHGSRVPFPRPTRRIRAPQTNGNPENACAKQEGFKKL